MITVKGQLTDAGNNAIKLGIIDCVSISNLGASFIHSNSLSKTDDKGHYEFTLKAGEYRIYAQVNMRSDVDYLGDAQITAEMEGEYTLEEIMDFSDAVLPPIVDDIWKLYREVQAHLFEINNIGLQVGVWHESVLGYRDTVITKHSEVEHWHNNVTGMHSDVVEKHNNVVAKHEEVMTAHADVVTKHDDVQTWHSDVVEKHEQVMTTHSDIVVRHDDITEKHQEVITAHADVVDKHNDVTEKHEDVDQWHGETSELRDEVEAIANDLDDAARYRGYFSPSTGYPPPPEVNKPYQWFCLEDGAVDGVSWEEGNVLFYAPHPTDSSAFGSYFQIAGNSIGDSEPKPIEIPDDLIMQVGKTIWFRDTIGGIVQAVTLDGNNDLLLGNTLPSSTGKSGIESVANIGLAALRLYHVLSQDEDGKPVDFHELLSTFNGVTLDGEQQVTGNKQFLGDVRVEPATIETNPAQWKQVTDRISEHEDNKENPHSVTVDQVGAAKAEHSHLAEDIEGLDRIIEDAIHFAVSNLYAIGDVWLTMTAENPSDKFGGVWALILGDANLSFGNGSLQTGAVTGNDVQNVPVAEHEHDLTSLEVGDNNETSVGTITLYSSGSGSTRTGTHGPNVRLYNGGNSGTVQEFVINNVDHQHEVSGSTDNAGTPNATINVKGATISVNVWQRTE